MSNRRTLLIRYDEIGLKGKNRRFFIDRLRQNIRFRIKGLDGISISVPHGRILMECDEDQADDLVRRLGFVPGIASLSVGLMMEPELDAIAQKGIEWISPLLEANPALKFCVRTKRSHKGFPFTSNEVDHKVGGQIMQALSERGLTVSLDRSDFKLEIEIGMNHTVVFQNRVPGLGGLPVGSAGKVLGLLSGGIDSPVAMYRLIKRGCRVHGVFFDNRPYMGKGGYDKVIRLCGVLNRYQESMRLRVVPFENIQVAIRDHCRSENRVVLYRRMMYRIAQAIADAEGYKALVTGESLGQVASQTLENLDAVSRVVDQSVFRPLIGMDKKEIITESKKVGTYDISIEAQPDCCSVFMPDRPATKAKIHELEDDETRYLWQDLMQEALEKMEVLDPEALPI